MAENAEVEEFTTAAPTPPPTPARVTKTWIEPAPQPVSTPKPSPTPSIGRQKKVDANQIIDELLDDPDNHKMRFRVGRDVGQVNWTGERIPAGTCGTLPIIPYNHLLEEIKQNWGAGHYSIQVIDAGGLQIVHYSRMVVEIPGKYAQKDAQDVAPPNFHQPQAHTTAIVPTRKHAIEDDDPEAAELLREEKRMQIQARIDQKRDEQEEREEKRAQRRRAARREELELARMEQEMKGGAAPKEESRLLAVIEEQKNTITQLRASYEEDRRRFQDALTQMQNNLMLAAKSDGGGMKEMLMMMQTQSIEMLKALSPALNRPPDNAALEVMQRASDMLIKATTRENSMERNLLNTLMTNMLNNKSNSIKDQMELVNMGREQLRESMEMAQAFTANLGGGRSGEEEGDGYDPGAGFLGNIGRGLFSLIKEISKQAATNPAFGQLLMNMFGNKQPSDEQIRRHARQMEMSGQQLPLIQMQPQMPMQQPQVRVQQPNPNMFRSPNFSSPNQTQPQPQQQAVVTPAPAPAQPMAPMPSPNQQPVAQAAAPAPQPQPQPQTNAAEQNLDLELELEGESSGMVAESASVTASYAAQVEQTTISGGSEEEMATPEARLRKFVTDSMEICLEDIIDKRNTRSWHDDAFDNWNGDFLQALAAMPSNDDRANAIAILTAAPIWEKLYDKLVANGGEELVQFHRNIDLLMEKVRAAKGNSQTAQTPAAAAAQTPAMAQA